MSADQVANILRSGPGPFVFTNIVVNDDLDLKETDVPAVARFNDCSFAGIYAERATMHGSLFFAHCEIGRFEAHHSHFNDFRIIGGKVSNLFAANASFEKTCSIRSLTISSISLSGARVSGNLRIKDVSAQRVNLERAAVNGLCYLKRLHATELMADGLSAQRLDGTGLAAARASLNRVIVKNAMNLTEIHVTEKLDIRTAEIGDDIFLNGCHVGDLDLSGTTSAHALYLDRSVIDRTLSITDGRFGYLRCSATVNGEVFIRDASFSRVDLHGIQFTSRFRFRRNTISGTMRISSADGRKPFVGGACSFRGTRLGGQLVIQDLTVTKRLSLASLSVIDLDCKALNIGGTIDLTGVSAARISLADSIFDGRIVADAVIGATTIVVSGVRCKSLIARGTRITGSLRLDGFDAETFLTTHASYGGEISFVNTRITSTIDLTKTNVGELKFDDSLTDHKDGEAFRFPKRTVLRECQYSSLQVQWQHLVQALETADDYDATAYRALESYVRTVGRLDWADEIYLRSKRQATSKLPKWSSKRNGQNLLEWISGYGARPWRLLRTAAWLYVLIWITVATSKWDGMLGVTAAATDVVLRGDKSVFIMALLPSATVLGAPPFSVSPTALLLAAFLMTLRYAILAFLGIWTAYITGLVRYVGGGRP